jgi:hypothetical protein
MAELRQRKQAHEGESPADDGKPDGEHSKAGTAPAALPEEQDLLTRHEAYVPYAIALLAGFTRFYRLDQPPGACRVVVRAHAHAAARARRTRTRRLGRGARARSRAAQPPRCAASARACERASNVSPPARRLSPRAPQVSSLTRATLGVSR